MAVQGVEMEAVEVKVNRQVKGKKDRENIMKRFICILIILFMASSVYAATVSYTVPDEKLDDFMAGFLNVHPNVEINGETGEIVYTNAQWIKERGRRWFIRQYQVGKRNIAKKTTAAVIDNAVIE